MLAVYLAGMQIGLYVTPINFHLVGPEVAYILGDSDAKVFVAHERFAEAAAAAVDEIDFPAEARFAVGDIAGFRPYAELGAGQPDTAPENRTTGAPMHYTSGTTGRPKGVKRAIAEIDPSDMGELTTGLLQMFGIQAGDGNVHITGSPLYHTAVLMWTACSLHLGHTVVLMDKWTPELMLELIDRHRVTTSHMVPTQFHRLLSLPDDVRSRYDVSSLRHMVHAAAPCPPEIKRRMIEWWGDAIDEYYAATEGGGTIITAKEWLDKPGSVGRPWPNSEIRILDEEGNQLPADTIGTVYMSLAVADFEYKGDRAKTDANRRDGFFTVGDVGELDDDGYLFLRDRKSDMIISGGVNIYPAEIEGELITHPKVGDVAVFGIPHPTGARRSRPWWSRRRASRRATSWPTSSWPTPPPGWAGSSCPAPSTSPTPCPAIPTASSTSASCATPTGKACSARSERRPLAGLSAQRSSSTRWAAISTSSPTWPMPDQPLTQPMSAENQTWPRVRVIWAFDAGSTSSPMARPRMRFMAAPTSCWQRAAPSSGEEMAVTTASLSRGSFSMALVARRRMLTTRAAVVSPFGRSLRHPAFQVVHPLDQGRRQQVVLRREVPVDGAEGHAGGGGHVAHLHRVIAALRAEAQRGPDHPLTASGLAPGQRLGGGVHRLRVEQVLVQWGAFTRAELSRRACRRRTARRCRCWCAARRTARPPSRRPASSPCGPPGGSARRPR